MTPEELEAIQDIGPEAVEQIQGAVNAYYSQFEEPVAQGVDNPEENLPEPLPESADMSASAEEVAEVQGTDEGSLELEPGPAPPEEETSETNFPPGTLYDPDSPEERFEPGTEQADEEPAAAPEDVAEQFGTIENAGSPTDISEEGGGDGGEKESGQ
jgi:hypothetical protein